jgi:hypothetical protein
VGKSLLDFKKVVHRCHGVHHARRHYIIQMETTFEAGMSVAPRDRTKFFNTGIFERTFIVKQWQDPRKCSNHIGTSAKYGRSNEMLWEA